MTKLIDGMSQLPYPVSGSIIDENGIVRLIGRAFANAVGAGNTEVVAAQGAGKKIRILAVALNGTAAVNVHFQSNVTAISATLPLAANGGHVWPVNQHGWFETVANDPLNVNLSGATPTGVQVTYVVIG